MDHPAMLTIISVIVLVLTTQRPPPAPKGPHSVPGLILPLPGILSLATTLTGKCKTLLPKEGRFLAKSLNQHTAILSHVVLICSRRYNSKGTNISRLPQKQG